MIHLFALDSTERFTILLGFITAVILLLLALASAFAKIVKAAWQLVEATNRNTAAVAELAERMERVEARTFPPPGAPEAQVPITTGGH